MMMQSSVALKIEEAGIPMTAVDPVSTEKVTIDTRFGTIEFDRGQAITFPKGIPGFGDFREFCLSRIPDDSEGVFLLLQSLEPTDLSFIVTAYDPASNVLQPEDLEAARHHFGMNEEDAAVMLIASVHQGPEGTYLTVNMQAPILLDTANRLGWQYIFQNEKYEIRYRLD